MKNTRKASAQACLSQNEVKHIFEILVTAKLELNFIQDEKELRSRVRGALNCIDLIITKAWIERA